ncbi:unnamed protein product [Ceratitis capitata]|uniref:(Mediterranean fruit fly) hypothetical protein n=1 Tax=Ceratitis capitata TaxID=7213 RepID=A0A811U808_CERCA|nr:unnamed protein product [Ceratitis capitata]
MDNELIVVSDTEFYLMTTCECKIIAKKDAKCIFVQPQFFAIAQFNASGMFTLNSNNDERAYRLLHCYLIAISPNINNEDSNSQIAATRTTTTPTTATAAASILGATSSAGNSQTILTFEQSLTYATVN